MSTKLLVYDNMTKPLPYLKNKIKKIKDFKKSILLTKAAYICLSAAKCNPKQMRKYVECIVKTFYMLTTSEDLQDFNNLRHYVMKVSNFEIRQIIQGVRYRMWFEINFWNLAALVNRLDPNSTSIVASYLQDLFVVDLMKIFETAIYRKMSFQIIHGITTSSGLMSILEEKYLEEFRLGYRNLIHIHEFSEEEKDDDTDFTFISGENRSPAPSLSNIF